MIPGTAYFDRATIRALAERSDWMGLWLVLHCWAVIVLAVVGYSLLPNILTFALAVMVVGSRQLGLAILMHEAAHNALFRTPKLNHLFGEWFCGRPILAELNSYRHYHLTHHRHTQTDLDPDLPLSAKFPTSRASLLRKFTRDLTGQTGIKQLAAQITLSFRLAGDRDAVGAARQDAAQALKTPDLWKSLPVFLAIPLVFSLAGQWWYGFAFWILPYLTWFQLVLRIRNIAEHGATEQSDNPLQNTRTTHAGWLERAFVAPYWVNYHLEHHMIMHVPCWRLPDMHHLLKTQGLTSEMRQSTSYAHALREAGW